MHKFLHCEVVATFLRYAYYLNDLLSCCNIGRDGIREDGIGEDDIREDGIRGDTLPAG